MPRKIVRHRDQHDRRVDRRQQDAERRVRERDPLVAVVVHALKLYRKTVQFACMLSRGGPAVRSHPLGERAADRARPARPPAPRRAPLPDLAGDRAQPARPRRAADRRARWPSAERVRPQSMAQTIAELEADGLVDRTPDPNDRRQILIEPDATRGRERARRGARPPRGLARRRRSRPS